MSPIEHSDIARVLEMIKKPGGIHGEYSNLPKGYPWLRLDSGPGSAVVPIRRNFRICRSSPLLD
jgi:hypothetical protein